MRSKALSRVAGGLLSLVMILSIPVSVFATTYPDDSGLGGFVARLYRTVLEREYDQDGYDYWTQGLAEGRLNASLLMDNFIFSPEFVGKNVSDDDYVTILYHSMMDRDPDEDGRAYWLNSLEAGMTRRKALACFIDSPEFSGICADYGVVRGNLTLTENVDIHTEKTMFVTRVYRNILGRDPDPVGLRNWTNYLVYGNSASDLLVGFIFSQEFINRNLSDYDYVAALYETCLGRTGSAPEITEWVTFMNTHMISRKYMLAMIVYSQEFNTIAANNGIVVGNVGFDENRDRSVPVNDFIIKAFNSILGRAPSASDVNFYAGELLGTMTGRDFISAVLGSPEYTSKNASNRDYVIAVYESALGRTPSEEEISNNTRKIGSNGKSQFLNDVFASDEFRNYCKNSGISANYSEGWNNTPAGRVYMSNGAYLAGWHTIDGTRYYFDPRTGVMATGWKYVDGLKYYFNSDGSFCQDVRDVLGPQDSYYLTVNCTTNTIMVYAKDDSGAYNIPVFAMICSSSAGGVTPSGTFTIQRLQAWRELMGPVWGQYCSRITGNYLFHSVWYYQNGNPNTQSVAQYNNLGKSVSHGCIRLTVADAKWIFDNCNGCQVKVFYSGEAAPFERPVPPPIKAIYGDYGHDPTDVWH